MRTWESDEEIQRFREYLQIPSVQPDIDYGKCVKFLEKQANELDLPIKVYELVPKKPVVVITWEGLDPNLPSIMLSSHMDVVPVYEEHWTHPPFSAHVTEDGFIYARGTQDMKSIGILHLEAVRRLKNKNIKLKRSVHVTFVPDEEIGGADGMNIFSRSKEFKELNLGLSLDESMPTSDPKTIVTFNGERTSRHIKITSYGKPGHGSEIPYDKTAGEKLFYVVDKLFQVRDEQKSLFESGVALGDVISINLTLLNGGVQVNVLPENMSASFDIRIPPHVDHDEFERKIDTWCKEAGEGVKFDYYQKNPEIKSTPIDESNIYWGALKTAVEDMGLAVKPVTCMGATDARFVRNQGIAAIGFSPLLDTEFLLHAHNEKLHVDAFKKGIDVMENVLKAVANV